MKEQGLNNLVRLLIAQKADVLLMGGDYQEGCEYVEPLFAALSRVKTPMGTYGVMGNNDYERCHDEIVRTMKHYRRRTQSFRLDTQRRVAYIGTLSQRFCHIISTYTGLYRRCFGG